MHGLIKLFIIISLFIVSTKLPGFSVGQLARGLVRPNHVPSAWSGRPSLRPYGAHARCVRYRVGGVPDAHSAGRQDPSQGQEE